jgi:hypothetical protein
MFLRGARRDPLQFPAASRSLAETYRLVQRGLGRAAAKGGPHVGCNFIRHLGGRPYCGMLAGQVVKGTGLGLVASVAHPPIGLQAREVVTG